MARSDAALRVYCESLVPGAAWSSGGLSADGFRAEAMAGGFRVSGAGVASCLVQLDPSGSAAPRVRAREFRPD
ncbi:MAG: hypothetical protein U0353_24375 [Sandaracinus sp.]